MVDTTSGPGRRPVAAGRRAVSCKFAGHAWSDTRHDGTFPAPFRAVIFCGKKRLESCEAASRSDLSFLFKGNKKTDTLRLRLQHSCHTEIDEVLAALFCPCTMHPSGVWVGGEHVSDDRDNDEHLLVDAYLNDQQQPQHQQPTMPTASTAPTRNNGVVAPIGRPSMIRYLSSLFSWSAGFESNEEREGSIRDSNDGQPLSARETSRRDLGRQRNCPHRDLVTPALTASPTSTNSSNSSASAAAAAASYLSDHDDDDEHDDGEHDLYDSEEMYSAMTTTTTDPLEVLEQGHAAAATADCHDESSGNVEITFRPIAPRDRQEIQRLHESWFPVSYTNAFYDELVLHRRLAGVRTTICEERELYTRVGTVTNNETIVACLVGSFVSAQRLSLASRQLLLSTAWPSSSEHRFPRLFYLMTLGTIPDYRHHGLATQLVEQCLEDTVLRDPGCGALYLHVLPSNIAAIRFYEKLHFVRVTLIKDYYTIDGQLHDAYLYAKYFHGNLGHASPYNIWNRTKALVWDQLVQRPLRSYWFKSVHQISNIISDSGDSPRVLADPSTRPPSQQDYSADPFLDP
jgi:ribosomal protein S18 acetylase RimI-like enzyme